MVFGVLDVAESPERLVSNDRMSSFPPEQNGDVVANTQTPGSAQDLAAPFHTQPVNDPLTADDDSSGKKKKTKRRKVNHACLYCRRSHMTCDEGRPCQRCIKREIGHLCHDERKPKISEKSAPVAAAAAVPVPAPAPNVELPKSYPGGYNAHVLPIANSTWPMPAAQDSFYHTENLGNEFAVLTEFLETLDDGSFFTQQSTAVAPPFISSSTFPNSIPNLREKLPPDAASAVDAASRPQDASHDKQPEGSAPVLLQAPTKTERFLLTAADQESGTRDERLNRVIRSKYEAGLLKPYNYEKGYARLSRWMDSNVSQESKKLVLQPLSVLRPKFRAVAQSLRDLDLLYIEEAFELLLLDYDRVFSAMGVPACLWRRTGEIYKGNREFTELVGLDGYMMREGRVCIYELMVEESAVNYWEKYGNVAFDKGQKVVLTSCVLRHKPKLTISSPTEARSSKGQQESQGEEGLINCCFSFTICRDKYGIPSMIVGNFIKC